MITEVNRVDAGDATIITLQVNGHRGWAIFAHADGVDFLTTPTGKVEDLSQNADKLSDRANQIIEWLNFNT